MLTSLCFYCVLSLAGAYQAIDLDIQQTKSAMQTPRRELNPLLGTHPSSENLDLAAVTVKSGLFFVNFLPISDRWKININKSVQFTEEMVTQRNGRFHEWPPAVGIVFSWEF